MAFVDHDQVEEVAGELLVDVHLFISAGDGLIERQVDLVGGINLASGDFGHRLAEGLEVVVLGLVDQDVAVGQKQDAFLLFRFPQPPDDLEGCVCLAGARGHYQQDTVLTARYSLDGAVDRIHLVIARHAPGAVVVVGGFDLVLGRCIQPLPLAVAVPKFGRAGELIKGKFGFYLAACSAAVVKQEAIAIAGEHERYVQRLCIAQGLLHTGADGVPVVLRLDYSDRQVDLVVEDEVCTACFATAVKFAPDDNAAFGKADFLAHLLVHVPSGLLNGWGNVLAANVPLGKRLFVHNPNSLSSRPGSSIPALLIVLDGRKCTLFDSGAGEE